MFAYIPERNHLLAKGKTVLLRDSTSFDILKNPRNAAFNMRLDDGIGGIQCAGIGHAKL